MEPWQKAKRRAPTIVAVTTDDFDAATFRIFYTPPVIGKVPPP
jgi:hypothetical protein